MEKYRKLFLAPVLCALMICFAWMFAFNVHAATLVNGGSIKVKDIKQDINIEPDKAYYYEFQPEEDADYVIYSVGQPDTVVNVYDSANFDTNDINKCGEALATNNDSGLALNFYLTCPLKKGKTYYFLVESVDGAQGITNVFLMKDPVASTVKSINYKPVAPIELIEGKDGDLGYIDNQGKLFVHYNLWDCLKQGDILTVNYDNNMTKTYMYFKDEGVYINNDQGDGWTMVSGLNINDDQFEKPWGLGDHTITLEYKGKTTTINVTVRESDKAIADKVTDKINALGSNPSEADVQAARKEYEALTNTQKDLVTPSTIGILESAEKKIADDKAKKDAEAKAKAEQAKKDAEAKAKAEQAKKDAEAKAKKKTIRVSKITINGISHNIAVGKKITLTATVLPKNATNKKVKWTTSNKKIATVSQKGVVTIKKKTGGKTVTIKATAADGSKKSKTWKIKVMKGVVKSVTIKGAKKQLKVNKTMKLKAVVKASKGANKKVKWTSSNKKFATVSSAGKVKALKAGKGKTVKITAQATDGSGKKKVVKIKIK